jgi:hypothetical protein
MQVVICSDGSIRRGILAFLVHLVKLIDGLQSAHRQDVVQHNVQCIRILITPAI